MYGKRITVFIVLIYAGMAVCLLRLGQMQLSGEWSSSDGIRQLKLDQGRLRRLTAIRGRIVDRKGRILATNRPVFHLCINYELSSVADWRCENSTTGSSSAPNPMLLEQVIEKCTLFGASRPAIEKTIAQINDRIWNLRTFLAWLHNTPSQDLLAGYDNRPNRVPFSEAMADFAKHFSEEDRTAMTRRITNLAEMKRPWPVLELKTADDVFTAQVEFLDMEGVDILPGTRRVYPYDQTAAQTIGWVGPPGERDQRLLADDRLSRYLDDEICGREDGAEFVYEDILRGRRGERIYDIDGRMVEQTPAEHGHQISLTIDIGLQRRIEQYLADCSLNKHCDNPMAAVVIDVETSHVLLLASLPSYDLNTARYRYTKLASDPNIPLLNRAVNRQYPPGSVVKPLVLIAGLHSGRITPEEPISCPSSDAPSGWPSCWIHRQFTIGHDDFWAGYGSNSSRNALKGSCNIYFSRLAERIEPRLLQRWLYDFGYGRRFSLSSVRQNGDSRLPERQYRQVRGCISSGKPEDSIDSFANIPPLLHADRRFFGIGQSNLRATPLQVANAMAAIARGGVFTEPILVWDPSATDDIVHSAVRMDISDRALSTVRDGMWAVVNEPRGTAHDPFAYSGFHACGVTVFGKTGSTENPENAWFAGFAEDTGGRKLAVAVVVERGQRGSDDAAPLARDMIEFCVEAGYLGIAATGLGEGGILR